MSINIEYKPERDSVLEQDEFSEEIKNQANYWSPPHHF